VTNKQQYALVWPYLSSNMKPRKGGVMGHDLVLY